jgi:TetR/AcrR family transcriptional regulator
MRDLERTKAKILKAALVEFCAKGLAGARTAAIARRAGVNKRMLFYCFGSKEELYREILRRKNAESERLVEMVPDRVSSELVQWDEKCRADIDYARLLEWEALESGSGPVVMESERRRIFKAAIAKLRHAQERGYLSEVPDIAQLLTALVGVTLFPYAFPQLVRLITGMGPTDREFIAQRTEFLRWFGERLARRASAALGSGPMRQANGAGRANKPALNSQPSKAAENAVSRSER